MGCSGGERGNLFTAGSKQTITYRVGTWNDYLEAKCEYVIPEKEVSK